MTVTTMERTDLGRQRLSAEQTASIRLAVAQWMRSARGVAKARDELRLMLVTADEIFRRRRAESADPYLAALLRLAVTVVITGGVLEESDRRRFAHVLDDDVVQGIIQHVADAQRFVSHAERSCAEPDPSVDLHVGDY